MLDTFEELQICAAYRLGDQVIDYVPDTAAQKEVAPVYETWPGWMSDTSGSRTWDDLPANAQRYLKRIQERGLGALLLTLLAAR